MTERQDQMSRLAIVLLRHAEREERIQNYMSFMDQPGDYWHENDQGQPDHWSERDITNPALRSAYRK